MRHPLIAKALLFAVLVLPAASLAQRMPQEFKPPAQNSGTREADARSKYNVGSYQKDINKEVTPVPWMAISLAGIAFLVAGLFAIPYYARTAKSQREAQEAADIRPRRIR